MLCFTTFSSSSLKHFFKSTDFFNFFKLLTQKFPFLHFGATKLETCVEIFSLFDLNSLFTKFIQTFPTLATILLLQLLSQNTAKNLSHWSRLVFLLKTARNLGAYRAKLANFHYRVSSVRSSKPDY